MNSAVVAPTDRRQPQVQGHHEHHCQGAHQHRAVDPREQGGPRAQRGDLGQGEGLPAVGKLADLGLGGQEHLHVGQAVAAQLREALLAADLVELKVMRPDPGELAFHRGLGRPTTTRTLTAPAGLRLAWHGKEGLAVDLAAGHKRQRVEGNDVRRHHVLRQASAQPGAKVVRRQLVSRGEAHELGALASLGQDRRLSHRGVRPERPGHLLELDAEVADLDLVVPPPGEHDLAGGELEAGVAREVDPRRRMGHDRAALDVAQRQERGQHGDLAGRAKGHRLVVGADDP
jgi:hypothetical protein